MSRPHLLTRRVAVFLLLYGVAVRADERLDAAVKRLASVSTFAFGGVGFAGVTSKGEIDFKFVLSQSVPVALAAFENLYANGNPQAKAYALAGIKKLNLDRFKQLLPIAGASTDEVMVMRGCILSHEPLRKIAQCISITSVNRFMNVQRNWRGDCAPARCMRCEGRTWGAWIGSPWGSGGTHRGCGR
jgi:hypothetical protein